MDLSSFVMPERRKKAKPPTPVQALAAEIAASFGEQRKVGLYLSVVKRIGIERARQIWREVEADGARNRAALFLWKSALSTFVILLSFGFAALNFVKGERASERQNVAGAIWHGLVFLSCLGLIGVTYAFGFAA
jgi:hypothetical protein